MAASRLTNQWCGMGRYASKSDYGKRMAQLSATIFNEYPKHMDEGYLKVNKLFSERPLDKKKNIVDYYPPHPTLNFLMQSLREYGLYRDEFADFTEEMERLRALRGKGKPPRGAGKRLSRLETPVVAAGAAPASVQQAAKKASK